MNYGPKIVTSGLILALDAADRKSYAGSGTAWNDLSTNRNNGTLINGPTFSSENGGNIVLDGVNDEIIITNSTSINVIDNVTVNMWIKINSSNFGSVKVLLSKYPSKGWEFVMGTDGKVGFNGRNGDGTYYNASNTPNLATNTWCCLTGQKTGLYWNMWLNGTQVQNVTASTVGDISDGIDIRIGTEAGSYVTAGNIASLQVYNRALSASEILQNFNATRRRFGI